MTGIILIKQCNAVQLAHLYEHLFCMAVDNLFYDNDLFPYVDYELSARVLHKGIIYVDVALHSEPAKKLAPRLPNLQINLSKDTIIIATSQIVAEKEKPLSIKGPEQLQKELKAIDELPWRDIDDVGAIDSKGIRRRIGALYLSKGKAWPARKTSVTISLDKSFAKTYRHLLPLFWQLAELISDNTMAEFYSRYGFYSTKIHRKYARNKYYLVHDFKIPYDDRLDTASVQDAIQLSLKELDQYGAYERLMADLRTASHKILERPMPNPLLMFEKTGILVGAQGWHEISNLANCRLILSKMAISVKSGRQKTIVKPNLLDKNTRLKP